MQKVVFTLCSNNYLAHAKTLGDSLQRTNPGVKFVIGLTDKLSPEIDYSFFEPFEILPYDKIGYAFEDMVVKYNIIEFNTSMKPFYFEYLFNIYGPESLVYYIDPDIAVYNSFGEMNELLLTNNVVLTPHILTPAMEPTPFEPVMLNVGIYNLGFIGMRYSENTVILLKWWQNRLRELCYIDFEKGLFVDQLWVNFFYILFEKVHVLRSPGCNMAYWNFNERTLLSVGPERYVNTEKTPLIFFHFSGYDPNSPLRCTRGKRSDYTTENRPDVAPLFEQYNGWLKNNRYDTLSKVAPLLPFKPRKVKHTLRQRIGNSIRIRTNRGIKFLFNV